MGRMVCYLGVHWWDTETRYLLLTMALYSTLAPSPGHADIYAHYSNRTPMLFEDLPALFGSSLPKDGLMGVLVESRPLNACSPVAPPPAVNSSILQFIALIRRLECNFDIKVLHAQRAGFSAAIVHNVNSDTLLHMSSSDERIAEKVWIPSVFTSFSTAQILKSFIIPERGVSVLIQPASPFSPWYYLIPISWILPICLTITLTVLVLRCVQWRRRMRRNRMTQKQLRKIPVKTFQKGDEYEVCVICLDGYEEGDRLRILPCSHAYHGKCVDTWLIQVRRSCPVCNTRVSRSGPECSDSESQAEREGAPPVPSPRQRCTPEPRPARRCSSETPGGTAMPPSQTGPPCQQGCGLDSRVINTVSHESVVFMC